MATTKKETVMDFFSSGYSDYDVDYRENSITESYDFIINTGSSKILLKIGQKRWEDSSLSVHSQDCVLVVQDDFPNLI